MAPGDQIAAADGQSGDGSEVSILGERARAGVSVGRVPSVDELQNQALDCDFVNVLSCSPLA